jgi:L-ascorbate metabolism protein UlaG (beta-lactamase superfamily)
MTYPPSDHYDGKHFFNPEPTTRQISGQRNGTLALLRARLGRDPAEWARWPRHLPNHPHPVPADGFSNLTFIGHSTFLLRLPGLTILTDPIFSSRCSPSRFIGPKRVRAPSIALASLPHVDIILVSHNHYDHMDLPSLRLLRKRFPSAEIVTTLGNAPYLEKKRLHAARELDWWQSINLFGAHITATPARHFSARTLQDRNRTLWGGFYIDYQGHKIYFAGDTGYTRFFSIIRERLGAPDLALLPIGAYEPRWFMGPVHMNPADATQAFIDLQAKRGVGMHFGTFQLTAEGIDAPLHDLAIARAQAGISPNAFTALDIGETTSLEPMADQVQACIG